MLYSAVCKRLTVKALQGRQLVQHFIVKQLHRVFTYSQWW